MNEQLFSSQKILLTGVALLTLGWTSPAIAGEGGASFYLLGSGGPGAADLPPIEGIYFDNTFYFYPGKAKADRQFLVGGNLVAGLDLKLTADFATVLWVPSTDFLGGTLGLGGAFAVAQPDVTVTAVVTGPNGGQVTISRKDKATVIGDPVLTAAISWPLAKNLAAAFSGTLNIPIGQYREGELANASFHRWIVDTSGALTWKDERSGWDLSGKAGLTFNGTNHYTNYDSGTDLHLEASVEKKLSKSFSLGVQTYHLKQITGDTGSGASLGSFKGRVSGVGPTAAYSFTAGKTPVSLRFRYIEEFNEKNRPNGRAFFFSVDLPLKMNLPSAAPSPAE